MPSYPVIPLPVYPGQFHAIGWLAHRSRLRLHTYTRHASRLHADAAYSRDFLCIRCMIRLISPSLPTAG